MTVFPQGHFRPMIRTAQDIPPLEEIERALFEAVNRERAALGIPSLRLNPALVELARRQSEDMARLGRLTHLSAAGDPFDRRLEQAGVLYAANAENVAVSDSFEPALIHESFMNSPGHRESLLDPGFDEAGIAVARAPDGKIYVTQDFIKSLAPLEEPEVRARLLEALEEGARMRGARPPSAVDELHETARAFAREKAASRDLPPMPSEFGVSSVHFFIGADLDGLLASVRDIDTGRFRLAGAGAVFERTDGYPGGAYVTSIVLLVGSSAADMNDSERRESVLAALNEVRAARGRRPIVLDKDLCRKADEYNRRFLKGERLTPPRKGAVSAVFYETQDIGRVPDELRARVSDREFRRAGISVLPLQAGASFSVRFSVAVLFED